MGVDNIRKKIGKDCLSERSRRRLCFLWMDKGYNQRGESENDVLHHLVLFDCVKELRV